MIIQCTQCNSKYQYDEERFERKPSKKIKCAKCQNVFEITNPAYAARPAPARQPEPGDRTYTRRPSMAIPMDDAMKAALASAVADSTGEMGAVSPNLMLPEGKRLSLAILDGANAGTVYRIEKPRVTIGRAGADFVIDDSEASRQHAAVEVRDTRYTLVDLGSTNGTMVDGNRIGEEVELIDKGEFRIGSTTLMLIVTEEF